MTEDGMQTFLDYIKSKTIILVCMYKSQFIINLVQNILDTWLGTWLDTGYRLHVKYNQVMNFKNQVI